MDSVSHQSSTSAGVPRRRRVPPHLAWLLACSAVMLILWSLVVPIYEAPDELWHWQYANHLHHHLALPYYDARFVEANQPPLYYLLVAPFATDGPTPPWYVWTDDQSGAPIQPPKFYFNRPDDLARYWPLRVSRLVTAGFSLLTVLFAYLAAYEATGNALIGLLAGSLTAFLPQFTFRGMNISNDAFVATTSSICLYLIVRLVRRGFSWPLGWATGAMLAVALLSKMNSLSFPIVCAFVVLSEKGVDWRERITRLRVFALTLVIMAPWLIRNQVLYGDPVAARQMFVAVPGLIDVKPITSSYFLHVFPAILFRSFVGLFGGMNLFMPDFMYKFFAIAGLSALLGFVWTVARGKVAIRLATTLMMVPIITVVLTAQFNMKLSQPQGRFLFPALTAIMVIAAIGYSALPFWNRLWSIVTIAGAIAINLALVLFLIMPAYWTGPMRPLLPDTGVSPRFIAATAGPLLPGNQFAQTFKARHDNLARAEVMMATWKAKIPSGKVRIHLMEAANDTKDIAVRSVRMNDITDNSYVSLEFPPIPDSNGHLYRLAVETENIPTGYSITVWLSSKDVYADGQFYSNGRALEQDAAIRTYYLAQSPLPSSFVPSDSSVPEQKQVLSSKHEGHLVRRPGSGAEDTKVYLVLHGQKHWILHGEWIRAHGYSWPNDVREIEANELDAIPMGPPITGMK